MQDGSSPRRTDHDDPIVADNSPARFNFKRRPDDDGDGKNYKRTYTTFESLTLVLIGQGGGLSTEVHPLKEESDIVFHLRSAANASVLEEIKLTAKKNNDLKIKAKTRNLKRKTLEVLEPDGVDDFRMTAISIVTSANKPRTISLLTG